MWLQTGFTLEDGGSLTCAVASRYQLGQDWTDIILVRVHGVPHCPEDDDWYGEAEERKIAACPARKTHGDHFAGSCEVGLASRESSKSDCEVSRQQIV